MTTFKDDKGFGRALRVKDRDGDVLLVSHDGGRSDFVFGVEGSGAAVGLTKAKAISVAKAILKEAGVG